MIGCKEEYVIILTNCSVKKLKKACYLIVQVQIHILQFFGIRPKLVPCVVRAGYADRYKVGIAVLSQVLPFYYSLRHLQCILVAGWHSFQRSEHTRMVR